MFQVFRKCLLALHKEGYLNEVDEKLLYANIEEVYDVNVKFWKLLKPVVDKSRSSKQLLKPSQLVHSFDDVR